MKKIILSAILPFLASVSFADLSENIPFYSDQTRPTALRNDLVLQEFSRLRDLTSRYEAEGAYDGMVGGLMFERRYPLGNSHTLLWTSAQDGRDQTIRLFKPESSQRPAFAISYHLSSGIIPGRWVLRRFVGSETGGWRADTVDAETGEVLDVQGVEVLELIGGERHMLFQWEVGR